MRHFSYFHFLFSWKPHQTIEWRWIEGQHLCGNWTSNLWPSYQKMREGLWEVSCIRLHIQSSPQWNIIDPQAPSPCWCAQVSLLAFWWWRSSLKKKLVFNSLGFVHNTKCFPNILNIFTILNACKLSIPPNLFNKINILVAILLITYYLGYILTIYYLTYLIN